MSEQLMQPCPICFEDSPYQGTCGSNDPRALCKRAAAPEGTVTIPFKWWEELLALCGPEDHELIERVKASIRPASDDSRTPSSEDNAKEAAFEKWLRAVCFQKPTPEAYDLARNAWLASSQDSKGEK